MNKIFIQKITNNDSFTVGHLADNETIIKNCALFFGKKVAQNLEVLITKGEDFYIIDKYCQYVIYLQYEKELKGAYMNIIEFKNGVDSMLDYYLFLKDRDWSPVDRHKIALLYEEIRNNNTTIAEMVML